MALAGYGSVPWDYSKTPTPRAGGAAGKPFVNPAVANLLQAAAPVPMGQPDVGKFDGKGQGLLQQTVMASGQVPSPNTDPPEMVKPAGFAPWPSGSGMSDGGPSETLATLIRQLLASRGGTDPVTQRQRIEWWKNYGSPPIMAPNNPVTKPFVPHGLVSKGEPVLKPYFGGMAMTPEMMQQLGFRQPTIDESNEFMAQSGGNMPPQLIDSPYGGPGTNRRSDIRLKSNIVRVGTHPRGVGVYDYDIDGHRERGVMAQELLSVLPEAVTLGSDGFLRVDYSIL